MDAGVLLRRSAQRFPDRVAVLSERGSLTFEALQQRSARLARGLLEQLRLTPGDRVAVVLDNRVEHVEVSFALAMAGLVWVRLNHRLSRTELAEAIGDSDAKAVVFGEKFAEPVSLAVQDLELPETQLVSVGQRPPVVGVPYADIVESNSELAPRTLDPEALATLWYTSGTSGRSKAIMLTHRNVMASAVNMMADVYAPISSNDVYMASTPFYWTPSVRMLPFIANGSPLVMLPQFDPARFADLVARTRTTVTSMVPTMLERLRQYVSADEDVGHAKLSSLRLITYGGAPMHPEQIRLAVDVLGPVLSQTYSQAEALITATVLSPADHVVGTGAASLNRLASCGKPYTNVDVRVVDHEGSGADCPPGAIGEIAVRGEMVMRGYWKRDAETAAALRDGWVHTRDSGYFDDEGYLHVVGRQSDMIITGGINVYPQEIEDALLAHPGVREVAVVGVTDQDWGEMIKAVVVSEPGVALTAEDIQMFCATRLASFKKPRLVEFRSELPRSEHGKILRRELTSGAAPVGGGTR